jgi:hypothetical protein
MKTKLNKKSRNLMIAMLLGDGSINAKNGFRMTHCKAQKDYLQWKINKLHEHGVRTNNLQSYISTKGYKVGEEYFYTRLFVTPFIKVLRRVFYKNNVKQIANRKLLNRLDALGIAIWYMDDGCINQRKDFSFYVRLSTCLPKEKCQTIIDYFNEVWDVKFYTFSEGRNTFSICCGTHEALKFLDIVKRYVEEVPCMQYKLKYDLSGRKSPVGPSGSKWEAPELGEDIV